jgi:salicylate hydroxylase
MRAAIVGAGIGGLTAAIALAARGIGVDVFERAPLLAEIGAGIQLSPNAMAVLEWLGVAPFLAGIVEPPALEIRSGTSGRRLTRIPLGRVMRQRYGAPYCVLRRTDLQQGLAAAATKNARIKMHLGTEVTGLLTGGRAVEIAGGESFEADLVIGADGVHSRLRTSAFDASGARAIDATAWRAVLPAADLEGEVVEAICLWLMPDAHLVHYPINAGRQLNLVLVARAGAFPADAVRHACGPLIERVAEWSRTPLFESEEGSPASTRKTILIGDAAHAMPPTLAQGGAMAIEDAVVLADSLAGRSVADGLEDYARRRRDRVIRVARMARRNLRLYELDGLSAHARDFAIAALPAKVHLARLDWLFGWRPWPNFPLPGERPLL